MRRARAARAPSERGSEEPSRPRHRFIELEPQHLSRKKAGAYVQALFRQADPSFRDPGIENRTLRATWPDGAVFEVDYQESIQDAMKRGTAESLRAFVNGNDPHFVFTLGMDMDGGEGVAMTFNYGGRTTTLKAPGRAMSIEAELTEDILHHRRAVGEHSRAGGGDGFRPCAMHYRSYLLSSCAMVEAFLNRPIIIESQSRTSPNLEKLTKPVGRLEEKFALWLDEFCGESLSSITPTAEWSQFQELSQKRNSLVHAADTMIGIELKDVARQLNLVRRGVGGLINLLRHKQSLPPVPFAERLETAPEARFVSEVPVGTRRSAVAPPISLGDFVVSRDALQIVWKVVAVPDAQNKTWKLQRPGVRCRCCDLSGYRAANQRERAAAQAVVM